MAFNINAHVILQGPKNISAVTSKIKSQLAGINVPVNLQVSQGGKGLGQLNAQLKGVTATAATTNKSVSSLGAAAQRTGASLSKTGAGAGKLKTNLKGISGQANQAAGAMQMLGRETALTFKRFAAAGIVTATVFRLGGAIAEATGKAIEFERELVRLQQVTGKTQSQLRGLKKSVTDLSTGLGIDANELANIARLFAQTGQTLSEVQNSMKAIARSSLAPTFGEMENTAEGLIAALSQFKIAASSSEEVLGSLNRVSKKFAVESQDMIAAIRRAGGVFALAAKQTQEPIEALQEFISIFTAVRSTTRESAETIATGLRTIFTRIQRRGTIDMLRELGINLTDAQGKFVGLFQSFKMLSTELDKIIQRGDAVTLSAITEELGGMRQVGKLIPAIREFRKAQRALDEAQRGAAEGLGGDVELGLKPLGKQLEQLSARWDTFIRKVTEGKTFQSLAKMAIDTANAFIALGDAVRPILPLLVSMGATKLAKGAVGFGAGFLGSTKGMGAGAGMGAGLGGRIGGVVSGKPSAGAGVSQSNLISALSNNTSAVGPNTSALQSLNSSLKGIPQQFRNLSSEFRNAMGSLRASIDQLKGSIASLGLRGGIGGPIGPMPRGPRRGFSGGGIVRGGRRRGYSSGGRVPFAAPPAFPIGASSPLRLTAAGTTVKGKGQVGSLTGAEIGATNTGFGEKVNQRIRAEVPTNYGAVFLRAADKPAAKTSGIHFRTIREDLRGSIPAEEILAEMSMFKQVPGQKGISKAGLAKAKGLGLTAAGAKGPRVKKSAMKDVRGMLGLGATGVKPFNYMLQARSLDAGTSERMQNSIMGNVRTAVDEAATVVVSSLPGKPGMTGKLSSDLKQINIDQIIGNIFEGALTKAGVPWSNELDPDLTVDPRNANATFDFAGPGILKGIFPSIGNGPIDAKATYNTAALASITKKVRTYAAGSIEEILLSMGNPRVGAAGGSASPTDPFNNEGRLEALLMPGEMQIQGVSAGTAKQIAGGNLRALFGVDPRKVALVPGAGNRDSVEADLAPGSFIVRKDIAQEALAQGYDPQARFSKRMGAATGGYTSRLGFKAGGRVGFMSGTNQPLKGGGAGGHMGQYTHTLGNIPQSMASSSGISKQFDGVTKAAKKVSVAMNKNVVATNQDSVAQKRSAQVTIDAATGEVIAAEADTMQMAATQGVTVSMEALMQMVAMLAQSFQKATVADTLVAQSSVKLAATKNLESQESLKGIVASQREVAASAEVAAAKHREADMEQQAAQTRSMAMMNFMGAATSAVFALQMLDFSTFEGSMISVTMLGMAAFQAVEAITAMKIAAAASAAATNANTVATTFGGHFKGAFAGSPIANLFKGGGGAAASSAAPFLGMSGAMGAQAAKSHAAQVAAGAGGGAGGAAFLAKFKAEFVKVGKFAGAALVAVAGVELGRLAGRKIIDLIFGKEVESKYAEGVTGRADTTAGQAGFRAGAAGVGAAGLGMALSAAFLGPAAPLGILIAAIYGGIKAFFDYQAAFAKQAEFLAFEDLGKAADSATEALKNFNKQEGVSATGIQKVNTEVNKYGDRLQAAGDAAMKSEYAQRQGPSAIGMGGGAAAGATIGAALTAWLGPGAVIGAVVGAGIGAIVGGIASAYDAAFGAEGRGEDSLAAADKTLGTLTDKMIEGMNKAFEKITEDFITNLADTTPHLAAIASLTQSIDMPDLTLSEVTSDFEALQDVLEKSGEKGKAFAQFLDQKLMVDMMESLKSADDNTKKLFAAATAQGIDITDSRELASAQASLAHATGLSVEQTRLAIDSMTNLNRVHREQIIQQIALRAKMEQLNRTMKNVKSSLDALITGLSIFAEIAGQTTDEFSIFADEVDTFVGRRLDSQFGIQQPGRGAINPLKNLETASGAAFEGAIKKIGMAIGKENAEALSGMKETIKLRKELPMILKDAVKTSEEKGGGKIATSEEVFDTLRESAIKLGVEFDDLPDVVKKNLKTSLSTAISRQGGQTAGTAMRKLLESGDLKEVLSKFGEVAEKARESLSNFYDGLNNFQKSLIDILNQLIRLEEYRIDQSLRAIDVVKQSNDAMDRFRIGITTLDDANAHLEERLNAIGGPVTMNPAQQQAQLQATRDENKQIRDLLAAQGGIAIGADMTPQQIEDAMASAIGPLNESQFLLIDALRLNEEAIVRETKKLDELINEQFRLEAATNELGLIQKAQMSAEQLARLFISKLARAEGETDPRRRAEMLKDLMLPFTSFSKAASGMTLNVRELDSVIANFPHIAAVLRSKGYDEKEIAKVRASFFGVFTRDFPGIMRDAFKSAGNNLDLQGPVNGLIMSIKTAMEPAGKLFEDLPDVQKIFDEIAAIAKAKQEAIIAESEANVKKIKEVIENNLGELKVDRKSLADLATEAKNAGDALRDFGTLGDPTLSAGNKVVAGLNHAGAELLKFRAQALEEAKEAGNRGEGGIKSYREYGLERKSDSELLNMLRNSRELTAKVAKGLGIESHKLEATITGMHQAEVDWVQKSQEDLIQEIKKKSGGNLWGTLADALEPDRRRSGVGGPIPDPDANDPETQAKLVKERQERMDALYNRPAKATVFGQLEGGEESMKEGLEAYRRAQQANLAQLSDAQIRRKSVEERGSGIFARILGAKPGEITKELIDKINPKVLREALLETSIERLEKRDDIDSLYENLRKLDEKAAQRLLKPLDFGNKQQLKIADSTERTAKAVEKMAGMEDDGPETKIVGDKKSLGGPIFGARHSRGGVDINAEGGEYVLSRKAVSRLRAKYGAGFLDKLNQGEVAPIAQAGGVVHNVLRTGTPAGQGFRSGHYPQTGETVDTAGNVLGKIGDGISDLSKCACSTKDEQILQQLLGHVKGQNAEFNDANLNLQAISGAIAEQPALLENLPSSIRENLAPLFGGVEDVAGGIKDAVEQQGKGPVMGAIQKSLDALIKGVANPIKKMAPSLTALEAFPQLTQGYNKMLENMGISDPFGSGGGEDDTKKIAKGMLDANELLNNLPDNIKEKMGGLLGKEGELATGVGENFCKCIDKLIAFLAGIPVEIGAEFGKELGGTKAKEAAKEAAKESAKEAAKEADKASGGGGVLGAIKSVVEKITTPHINNIKQIGGAAIDAVKGPIENTIEAATSYFKNRGTQQDDTATIEQGYADAVAAGKASLEAAVAEEVMPDSVKDGFTKIGEFLGGVSNAGGLGGLLAGAVSDAVSGGGTSEESKIGLDEDAKRMLAESVAAGGETAERDREALIKDAINVASANATRGTGVGAGRITSGGILEGVDSIRANKYLSPKDKLTAESRFIDEEQRRGIFSGAGKDHAGDLRRGNDKLQAQLDKVNNILRGNRPSAGGLSFTKFPGFTDVGDIDPETGFRKISKEEEKRREGLDKDQHKKNMEKLKKHNEERAKKGLRAQTLSQAIAEKRMQQAKERVAKRKTLEDSKEKAKATAGPTPADKQESELLKKQMGIQEKEGDATKKQTVELKGGICGCFETAIDKLIAFLMGMPVEISSEFAKELGVGGGAGAKKEGETLQKITEELKKKSLDIFGLLKDAGKGAFDILKDKGKNAFDMLQGFWSNLKGGGGMWAREVPEPGSPDIYEGLEKLAPEEAMKELERRERQSAGPPLQLQDMVSAITSKIGGLMGAGSNLLARGGGLLGSGLASGLGRLLGGGGKKDVVDSSAGGGEGGVASGAGKMQVQMRGGLFGLCDCFTAAIDKLIAFLAGEEVSIGGGGAGGPGVPGGPGTPGGAGGKGIFEILFDAIKGAGKTILGNFKTIGQGILTAFPKLKPIVDTVVGAFKDIPGTLGKATDFVKDAWGKLGEVSDKLKKKKEEEAKDDGGIEGSDGKPPFKTPSLDDLVREGMRFDKPQEPIRTRANLTEGGRVSASVPTLLDPNAPPFPKPPRPLPDNMNDWGPEDWDEADRSIFGPMAGLMGVPVNEAQDKERLRKSAENPYGHPTGNVPGPWRYDDDHLEKTGITRGFRPKIDDTEPEVKLPEGVSNALQNIGGFLGGASNQAAGGIAGAVGNIFKKPGTGAATPAAGGAPTGGPLMDWMNNMSQDPLGFMIYQQEQNKRKYKSQGGRLPDPVGPLSPERLDYLEGIEKTAPRLAGQKDKMSGQETIQRAVGTTSHLQERLARMKANREKIQAQLDQAEKKGLSKDSKIYKSREQRVKNLDESMGAIQSVLDQRAGKDQGFKPNIPGLKPPAYPGGANFPARPPGQQGPSPQGQQQAQQMLKTMGFSSSFTGGQRKVKLTDTPLAAADKIISFLSSACLMTKPCEVAQDPGEGGGILSGIGDKIKGIIGNLIGVGKGGLQGLIKGGMAGFGQAGIGGAIAGGLGGGIGGILGSGSNLLESLLPGFGGVATGGMNVIGSLLGLGEATGAVMGPNDKPQYPQGDGTYGPNKPPASYNKLPSVGPSTSKGPLMKFWDAMSGGGTTRPNYRGVSGAYDALDRGEAAKPSDIRRGPYIPGQSSGGAINKLLTVPKPTTSQTDNTGDMSTVEAAGNVFNGLKTGIDKLISAGPLVNDETIKVFASSNETLVNAFPSFQASVDKLSQVLATSITLSIVAPEKAIPVNVHITGMNEIMNKLQNIVTVEVFQQVTNKLQEQINSIKSDAGPLGGSNMDMNLN